MKIKAGTDVIDAIKMAYAADKPVMLEGRHGVGKSQLLEQAAKELKIDFIVRDLSLMEPPDLVGLPVQDNGRTRYSPPAFLPDQGKGLLVFEEINRSEKYMMAPCLELLTRRVLGDFHLPKGWLPVAAINPSEDGYDTNELDPALLSRFVRLKLEACPKMWTAWADDNKIHPAVVQYVRASGADIFESGESNPRTWCYISDMVRAFEKMGKGSTDLLLAGVAGLVGDIHGTAFVRAYLSADEPFDAATIIERYNRVRRTVRDWAKAKKTGVLSSTARNVKCALQDSDTCAIIAGNREMQVNLAEFIRDLPGDLGRAVMRIAKQNGVLS